MSILDRNITIPTAQNNEVAYIVNKARTKIFEQLSLGSFNTIANYIDSDIKTNKEFDELGRHDRIIIGIITEDEIIPVLYYSKADGFSKVDLDELYRAVAELM